MDKPLIMLIEDDPAVTSAVRRRLTFEGYRVETSADGVEAMARLNGLQPDLIILDIMLPGMDGFAIAESIRGKLDTPLLMLTARSSIEDRVAGLERGADDYLVKPFAIEELLARVRALLRRSSQTTQARVEPLAFADLVVNPKTQEVSRAGRSLILTRREYQLLEHFMRHPREVLTREAIFEAIWGPEHEGESNIIDVNVYTLREKLETGRLPRLIQTVRGFGYALREQ